MNQTTHPESFLPLTPAVMHILLALSDGEKHGYAIMQVVDELTGQTGAMGPGTLYGTIKRLLASGLVEECDERPDPSLDDQRRRYYRLSGMGEKVLAAEVARLAALLKAAKERLPGVVFHGGSPA